MAQISRRPGPPPGTSARQLDLEQLALLAEFDGDPGAVSRILDALQRGYNVEYEAERIRQHRAEAAEHQQLLDELQAAGVQITTDLPAGAARLSQLLHDGEDLTPETHGSCPGRGAFFYSWALQQPRLLLRQPRRARPHLPQQPVRPATHAPVAQPRMPGTAGHRGPGTSPGPAERAA